MENNSKPVESLMEKTMDYVKISIQLMRLKTIDKIAIVGSSFIASMIMILFFLLFFLFFNLGLGLLLGELTGKVYIGFFIVAGFYCVIALILLLFKKYLKNCIYNKTIGYLRKNKIL